MQKLEKNAIPEQTNHVLFQLTGALRNLASDDVMHESFVNSQAVYQLCQALDLFSSDIDIVSNISRTLSTISTNDDCCEAIATYKGINKIFVNLFKKYPGNDEIVVRLAYTIGNLVAKLDNTRIEVNSKIVQNILRNFTLFVVLSRKGFVKIAVGFVVHLFGEDVEKLLFKNR